MTGAQPQLDWQDGAVPMARAFGDTYFSREDGLAEARHVFLAGNGLPARLRDGFRIAELGFGTGRNLLALAHAWQETGQEGVIDYTGFEAFPMAPSDMARALAPLAGLAPLAALLVGQADGLAAGATASLPGVTLRMVVGDARTTLPHWQGRADAWFLDGFAPARNPGIWAPELMAEVARHTAPGGTCASYTAAGGVRRALAAAGFTVERAPGFGRKRHMTRGRLARPGP